MNMKPPITVMTSRAFNQDRARAKRAARTGPVFITDRGEIAFVMMSKEAYDRLKQEPEQEPEPEPAPAKPVLSLREALMDPRPEADFDFDFPELKDAVFSHPVDFETD